MADVSLDGSKTIVWRPSVSGTERGQSGDEKEKSPDTSESTETDEPTNPNGSGSWVSKSSDVGGCTDCGTTDVKA